MVFTLIRQLTRTTDWDNRTRKFMEQQQQMFKINYITLDLKTVPKWKKQPVYGKITSFSLFFVIFT